MMQFQEDMQKISNATGAFKKAKMNNKNQNPALKKFQQLGPKNAEIL